MPFCQAAPLLPSVTRRQNGMEYWWEGSASIAVPPTSAYDIVGQQNNIGGITFGAAFVLFPTPKVSLPSQYYFCVTYTNGIQFLL